MRARRRIIYPALFLLACFLVWPIDRGRVAGLPSATFQVQVIGHGPPVLLIPGLGCSGQVWDATVAHLRDHFQCHIMSLRGFGGVPPLRPLPSPFLLQVRDEIIAYLRAQKMPPPIIIGHSLGGFLALWIAETAPDLPRRVVIVDSIPFAAAGIDPRATVPAVKARASQILSRSNWLPGFVIQGVEWKEILSMTNSWPTAWRQGWNVTKSDRPTISQSLVELLTTDLRPALPQITCPVLILKALGEKKTAQQKDAAKHLTLSQYATLPHAKIIFFDRARHFIVDDDPAGYFQALDTFLSLPSAKDE